MHQISRSISPVSFLKNFLFIFPSQYYFSIDYNTIIRERGMIPRYLFKKISILFSSYLLLKTDYIYRILTFFDKFSNIFLYNLNFSVLCIRFRSSLFTKSRLIFLLKLLRYFNSLNIF